jgi:hypothetical protein
MDAPNPRPLRGNTKHPEQAQLVPLIQGNMVDGHIARALGTMLLLHTILVRLLLLIFLLIARHTTIPEVVVGHQKRTDDHHRERAVLADMGIHHHRLRDERSTTDTAVALTPTMDIGVVLLRWGVEEILTINTTPTTMIDAIRNTHNGTHTKTVWVDGRQNALHNLLEITFEAENGIPGIQETMATTRVACHQRWYGRLVVCPWSSVQQEWLELQLPFTSPEHRNKYHRIVDLQLRSSGGDQELILDLLAEIPRRVVHKRFSCHFELFLHHLKRNQQQLQSKQAEEARPKMIPLKISAPKILLKFSILTIKGRQIPAYSLRCVDDNTLPSHFDIHVIPILTFTFAVCSRHEVPRVSLADRHNRPVLSIWLHHFPCSTNLLTVWETLLDFSMLGGLLILLFNLPPLVLAWVLVTTRVPIYSFPLP